MYFFILYIILKDFTIKIFPYISTIIDIVNRHIPKYKDNIMILFIIQSIKAFSGCHKYTRSRKSKCECRIYRTKKTFSTILLLWQSKILQGHDQCLSFMCLVKILRKICLQNFRLPSLEPSPYLISYF